MKTRIILIIGCLLLFNSCILKSLQPFYIAKAISYQEGLLGNWKDNQKGTWNIASFKTLFEREHEEFPELSKEDRAIYNKYKQAYFVTYTEKEKEATFIAMPFKVNDKLFIDFAPFDSGLENENELLAQHLIRTHSIAKVEVVNNKKMQIKWLDESKVQELQEKNEIRLQHEKIGIDETFVLTATSNELYKFIEKFEATRSEDQWGSSDEVTLERTDAKP
jgi:hypothetical protein